MAIFHWDSIKLTVVRHRNDVILVFNWRRVLYRTLSWSMNDLILYYRTSLPGDHNLPFRPIMRTLYNIGIDCGYEMAACLKWHSAYLSLYRYTIDDRITIAMFMFLSFSNAFRLITSGWMRKRRWRRLLSEKDMISDWLHHSKCETCTALTKWECVVDRK